MAAKMRASGRYELVEDEHRHRFLVLDARRWYVWIDGQRSPILVHSRRSHAKTRSLQRGRYYLVEFHDDPKFRDLPHLFLQKGERFQEFLLPNGLPSERDPQKRFVVTRKTLPKKQLEAHLAASVPTERKAA
jgi:hypothetical protein